MVKNLSAMRETWVSPPSWEDVLEKGMATHSHTLALQCLCVGSRYSGLFQSPSASERREEGVPRGLSLGEGFQSSLCCGLTAKYMPRIQNFCKQY